MTYAQKLKNEAALDNTYSKGLSLALNGSVLSCSEVDGKFDWTPRVEGSVKGSRGAVYQVSVTLDLDDEDIVNYTCDCPASYEYDGMCKHEIALALEYLDRYGIESLTGKADPLAGVFAQVMDAYLAEVRAQASSSGAKRPKTTQQLPTDRRITELVNAAATQAMASAASARAERAARRGEADQPAQLEVTLLPTRDIMLYGGEAAWSLKLKARRGKAAYIVKNIGALVDAWKHGDEVVYGKNLTLAHVPSAFDERSRRLIEVVCRVADSQEALFSSRWNYWDAGKGTEVKELPLSTADIIAVLDVMQGSTVSFDATTNAYVDKQSARQLSVTEGDPQVHTRLAPARDGGFDLILPAATCCFAQGETMYVLDTECAWRCSKEFTAKAGGLLPALLPSSRPLHIAPADMPGFCRDVLPALRACTQVEAPDSLDALVPPKAEFSFQVGLDDGEVTCHVSVTYGDWTANLYEEHPKGSPARDMGSEYRVQDVVEEYFPYGGLADLEPTWQAPTKKAARRTLRDPRFDEADDERLYLLLTEGLEELSALGEVLLSERLRGVCVRTSPQVSVRANIRSGLLDLAVDSSGLSHKDLEAFLACYKRKQKFLRLSSGDIVKIDESLSCLNDLAEGLGMDVADLAGGAQGLPTSQALFIDALLRKSEGVRLERNAAFRSIVRDFETFSDADFEVPASLAQTLRHYQVEGFRWLETLERFGFGGVLADDMGLGKTLQVIAHILARKEAGGTGPTLVVCPASLVYNWMAELERFAPELDAVAVVGGKPARTKAIAQAADHDVLVTSYDLMKRDVEAYSQVRFARAVLDEAHYIKNANAQVSKAAKCLNADVRLALTGTPIENRLAELWSIFDFLMPGALGSATEFNKRFAGPVEAAEEGAARRLQCKVSPFILRRLKADVLADLPEKDESVVFARMDGEQDKLYKASQDRLAIQVQHEDTKVFKDKKLQILAELTKLRQLCCDPHLAFDNYTGGSAKLDTCMELIVSAIDAGHKILLFSQFTSMLDIISERLKAAKVSHFTLTGATSKQQRAQLVERFQAGEAPVFLISLKAGGVGLNLTAADVVIHYDPWWNLAAQNQATDRAHRIGQTRNVSVYKLICQGTIEERIVTMQERKRDLAESVLGGEGVGAATLTREDVLALLGSGE